MIVAKANFGSCPAHVEPDKFEDMVNSYLAALLHNWQILKDFDLAWLDDELSAYTLLPTKESYSVEYLSSWAREELEQLIAVGTTPEWQLLDDRTPEELQKWSKTTKFVLYTHLLDKNSPVVCLETRHPVAAFRLPISDADRDDLFRWACQYRECDSLQMDSGNDLEISAYTQMAEVNSGLSECGRKICTLIEAATKRPTFYYLHKYWDKDPTLSPPSERLCPSCGGTWHRGGNAGDGFYDFDYQCDECRVVSNVGEEFHDPKRASIGEWKARKKVAR